MMQSALINQLPATGCINQNKTSSYAQGIND